MTYRTKSKKAATRGLRLTNPDRVIFTDAGITKRALFDYYDLVSRRTFDFYKDRPASLLRCPDGVRGKCFFQKHASAAIPDDVGLVWIQERDGARKQYVALKQPKALPGAVQGGAIEIHLWGSRMDRIEHPDKLIFDLDPDEALDFTVVRDAAIALRGALDELQLRSFAMITGGKGVHLVCPLARTRQWGEVKAFARGVAEVVAKGAPDLFVSVSSKARRKGRIFVDWMRNQRGATAIAPYAVRAREGAPVAAPVSWVELGKLESAAAFDISTMTRRIARGVDPWDGYLTTRQLIRRQDFHRIVGVD